MSISFINVNNHFSTLYIEKSTTKTRYNCPVQLPGTITMFLKAAASPERSAPGAQPLPLPQGLPFSHFIYRGDPYRGTSALYRENALYICLGLIAGLTLYIMRC